MRRSPVLLALVCLAACSGPRKGSSELTQEVPLPSLRPTDLVLTPPMWETTGSEVRLAMRLADGPALRRLDVRFSYTGPGEVELPAGGTVPEGSDEVRYDGTFVSESSSNDACGVVQIIVTDPTDGETIAEVQWPVLHRSKILSGIETVRTAPMVEDDYFACYVAVRYEPMPRGMGDAPAQREAPAQRDAQVELRATVQRQGGFDPEVVVVSELDRDVYQRMPMGFEEDDTQRVFFVSVRRPAFPPMRRAYLNLEATIGGDTQKTYVPLPNR